MLTNEPPSPAPVPEPRGWRIETGGLGLSWTGQLWLAGAHATDGQPLDASIDESVWALDCAGLVASRWRGRAGRVAQWVFEDLEHRPPGYERLLHLCRTWAEELPSARPRHVVVVCAYGLNRSALAAGLILREAGVPAEEALARIRASRPGALNNAAFVELLLNSG